MNRLPYFVKVNFEQPKSVKRILKGNRFSSKRVLNQMYISVIASHKRNNFVLLDNCTCIAPRHKLECSLHRNFPNLLALNIEYKHFVGISAAAIAAHYENLGLVERTGNCLHSRREVFGEAGCGYELPDLFLLLTY